MKFLTSLFCYCDIWINSGNAGRSAEELLNFTEERSILNYFGFNFKTKTQLQNVISVVLFSRFSVLVLKQKNKIVF